MTLWMPFFFLLVDSWLLSAGFAGVAALTGRAALGSAPPGLEDVVPLLSDEDAAGSAELAVGCAANELVPGVKFSTVADFPIPGPPVIPSVGGPPKLRVSSPDSLAGVIVGAPL